MGVPREKPKLERKTKEVMLRLPMEVYEKWEALHQLEAPLTPLANYLAEKTRIGVEEALKAKKEKSATEQVRRTAGE